MKTSRYIVAFLVTAVIFAMAFLASTVFSSKKIDQLRDIQDKISTDILSIEIRFSLLGSTSCEHLVSNDNFENELTNELNSLAGRVKFMESERGVEDADVLLVKEKYNLLQIKDYLLMKELGERCKHDISSIVYFHSQDCTLCSRQSAILDEIHRRYPTVRIYWMDKDLSTPAVQTLVSMFEVKETPTIFIDGTMHPGLIQLEDLEKLLPEEITNPIPDDALIPDPLPSTENTPSTSKKIN